jgi:oligoribonuclease
MSQASHGKVSPNDSGAAPSANHLAWLDLEMTGLDVERDVILQAAVLVTDAELNVLDELAVDIWQPESELDKMSPFVRDMHEKTGLLARVRKSRVDLKRAQELLLGVVARHCSYPATLCGNSIWQDRKFLDKYMPGLAGYMHYRLLDVSAIKTVVLRYYPPALHFKKSSAGEHDALTDIRNSIAEFRHYQESIFRAR